MVAFKVLSAFLLVCVAQNVAYAGLFDNEQIVDFGLVKDITILGTDAAKVLECLPKLTDAYKWLTEFKGLFREYKDINLRNSEAKLACNKLPAADKIAISKCLKDAEDAMVAQKVKLFENVDSFTTKTYELYFSFRNCVKSHA